MARLASESDFLGPPVRLKFVPMTDILDKSLRDVAEALRAGEVSCEQLAEAAIANHERTSESLGAYKAWKPEWLREQARAADAVFAAGADLGPLHGIPVSIKDLYGVKGFPTFAGSPKRLPPKWESEGPVVTSLRRQQALISQSEISKRPSRSRHHPIKNLATSFSSSKIEPKSFDP